MCLEKMSAFFDARVDTYDEHMMTEIVGADRFYAETARLLPRKTGLRVLDLGCGTGLEIEELYRLQPDAIVTGIDLSKGMLDAFRKKFPDKPVTLIQGSYFEVDFGEATYDAVVSVESLHHFPRAMKVRLYQKILRALNPGGVYVETDYTAPDQAYEDFYFSEYARLSAAQGGQKEDEEFFHYDTPQTVDNLLAMRAQAGFSNCEMVDHFENTAIIVATK